MKRLLLCLAPLVFLALAPAARAGGYYTPSYGYASYYTPSYSYSYYTPSYGYGNYYTPTYSYHAPGYWRGAYYPAGSYAWHPAGYWLKDGYPYYGEPRPAAAYPEAPCHKPDAGNALAAEVLLRLLQAQNPLSPPVTQTPLAAPPQLTAQEIAAVRQAIYSQQQAQAQFQQQQPPQQPQPQQAPSQPQQTPQPPAPQPEK
jgi:hypothetical protein